MAGHNKWSKIKRQKAREDRRKSKIWAKLSQEIETAAREGGGDPEANVPLAQAIERAEAENMAKDTIERAIKRGTGELDADERESATYEGYGPHGVAVFVETRTDNTNRTVKDLRNLFERHSGNLGKDGSVGYLFERKGRFEIPRNEVDEFTLFEIVADAGAEDLWVENDRFVVITPVDPFDEVETALDEAGLGVVASGLRRIPTTTVTLDPSDRDEVRSLVQQIQELNDVTAVYTTLQVDGHALASSTDD